MLAVYIGLPLVFITLAVCIGVVEYRPVDPEQTQRARAEKQRMIDVVGMERRAERLAAGGFAPQSYAPSTSAADRR